MDRGTSGLQSMQSESDTTEQLRTHEQSYGHHLLQGMLGKLVLHFSGGNEQEREGWDWLGTAFVHGTWWEGARQVLETDKREFCRDGGAGGVCRGLH